MKRILPDLRIGITALLLFPLTAVAQTQIDTVYSTPSLDGNIYFNELWNKTGVDVITPYIGPGDMWDMLYGGMGIARAYLDFNFFGLWDTVIVTEAILGVYQSWIVGNSQIGVYPQWDIPGGDTLFCMVDHITYSDTLDTLDWSAGDPGDPQTLHPRIGVISEDADTGYKTMDVTEYVNDDIHSGRHRTQFRIAFDIQKSDDRYGDYIAFVSGDGLQDERPYLIVTHHTNTGIEQSSNTSPLEFRIYPNYPNPFNLETVIQYALPIQGRVKLQVLDLWGREVKCLVQAEQPAGSHRVRLSAEGLTSGMYFCRLTLIPDQGQPLFETQKIMIIK